MLVGMLAHVSDRQVKRISVPGGKKALASENEIMREKKGE